LPIVLGHAPARRIRITQVVPEQIQNDAELLSTIIAGEATRRQSYPDNERPKVIPAIKEDGTNADSWFIYFGHISLT
jgi:hypothetical protein